MAQYLAMLGGGASAAGGAGALASLMGGGGGGGGDPGLGNVGMSALAGPTFVDLTQMANPFLAAAGRQGGGGGAGFASLATSRMRPSSQAMLAVLLDRFRNRAAAGRVGAGAPTALPAVGTHPFSGLA